MTIEDPAKFCAGLWDWGILDGCFGMTKIKPTDIDGFVERGGKFLFFETKAPGAKVPEGQRRTFEALCRTGVFTIFVVWGETNKPEQMQIWTRHKVYEPVPCNTEKLRHEVARWFTWANRGGADMAGLSVAV